MRDDLVLVILLIGAPLIGWSLVDGFRTGIMDAAGVPLASYSRAKQPFLFWLAAAFNGAICVGSIALLIAFAL